MSGKGVSVTMPLATDPSLNFACFVYDGEPPPPGSSPRYGCCTESPGAIFVILTLPALDDGPGVAGMRVSNDVNPKRLCWCSRVFVLLSWPHAHCREARCPGCLAGDHAG